MINTKKLLKPIDKKKELKHIIFKCRAKRLIAAVSTERNHWQPKILRQVNDLSIKSEIKTIFR